MNQHAVTLDAPHLGARDAHDLCASIVQQHRLHGRHASLPLAGQTQIADNASRLGNLQIKRKAVFFELVNSAKHCLSIQYQRHGKCFGNRIRTNQRNQSPPSVIIKSSGFSVLVVTPKKSPKTQKTLVFTPLSCPVSGTIELCKEVQNMHYTAQFTGDSVARCLVKCSDCTYMHNSAPKISLTKSPNGYPQENGNWALAHPD